MGSVGMVVVVAGATRGAPGMTKIVVDVVGPVEVGTVVVRRGAVVAAAVEGGAVDGGASVVGGGAVVSTVVAVGTVVSTGTWAQAILGRRRAAATLTSTAAAGAQRARGLEVTTAWPARSRRSAAGG
jgi:hypothetical protein